VGTCLPETLIAVLAILFGERSGHGADIGIGAILGAPLMLSTLAFAVTGGAVLAYSRTGRRSAEMNVSHRVLARDLRYFFIVFTMAAAASFLPANALRKVAAIALVGLYVDYVRRTFADHRHVESDEDISPLRFGRRWREPPGVVIAVQIAGGLALLVFGAKMFVAEIEVVAQGLGVALLVLSLVITPIATELPEKFNSIIWVRQGKDTLAIGNISGAMVFQSSIPPAIGIAFTRWELNESALACIVVAIASSASLWLQMVVRRRISPWGLLAGAPLYGGYLWWVLR
jgi:cation:H+ antiporter